MMNKFFKFLKDKSGVTAIEYGLIAALVGVAIIGGVTLLGGGLNTMFTDVNTTLTAASPVAAPADPAP
ncbi:MAG: Flp family type IVb pilin [Rhodospirillaceae bacterium]|nr:Flp family type IVb pilin [Rhodospirillaceae bacterium]MBT3629322.1 Flp family type IVb pilin [Rhodospirillaceae bacterium]MBT3927212.1 Flp family type IVb pilin [Rhodospirillaceae bacterium]MBT4427939.1 Flp family type IVb pilin [Rhodospirillaceae bacterium]MBT5037155.1 Flp family type IVb pilin [Rhodospirillaceae bacterium]